MGKHNWRYSRPGNEAMLFSIWTAVCLAVRLQYAKWREKAYEGKGGGELKRRI